MGKISATEKVSLVYKNSKVVITGQKLKAVLSISSDQLKNIYWGNVGQGSITLDLEEEAREK